MVLQLDEAPAAIDTGTEEGITVRHNKQRRLTPRTQQAMQASRVCISGLLEKHVGSLRDKKAAAALQCSAKANPAASTASGHGGQDDAAL